mmetsp:Transcript_18481/g.23803  ORF Transcript_18481/g.23803 Transcript_18481/m.23803 type:complete len:115 (+) Transcript_18481:152-496(+)
MGLASHALGVSTGKVSYLTRASQLYHKVYVLLSEHRQGISDVTLLLLATCNSMGHIHSTMLNSEGVMSCHRNLQSALSSHQSSGIDSYLDLDFFFMALVLGNSEQGRIPMAPAA